MRKPGAVTGLFSLVSPEIRLADHVDLVVPCAAPPLAEVVPHADRYVEDVEDQIDDTAYKQTNVDHEAYVDHRIALHNGIAKAHSAVAVHDASFL